MSTDIDSNDHAGMARDLERLQRDLLDQRQRLETMQAQIARFMRDREESLRGHKPTPAKLEEQAKNDAT